MADPRSPTRTPDRRHVPTGDLLETGSRGCGNPASRDDTRVTQLPSGALSWAGEDWSHVLDPYWCGSHLWHPTHEQPCRKTPTRETHVRGSAGPPGSISAPMEAGQGIAGRTQGDGPDEAAPEGLEAGRTINGFALCLADTGVL